MRPYTKRQLKAENQRLRTQLEQLVEMIFDEVQTLDRSPVVSLRRLGDAAIEVKRRMDEEG